MAVAFGAVGASVEGTTSLAVPYPTGISAGDLLVLCVANKYPSNAPSTPAGWTLPTNGRASGGSGSSGFNTGQVYISVFVKEATGAESGTLTVSVPSANCSVAHILRYTKTAATWLYECVNGSDNSAGTSWSVTAGSDPGITAGSVIVVASGINSNSPGSSQSVSVAGLTIGTQTERADTRSSSGNFCRVNVSDHVVSSGSSSGSPVFTMTLSGSGTNYPAGASVFLVLSEAYEETLTLATSGSTLTASAAIDASTSSSVASSMAQTGLLTIGLSLSESVAADMTFEGDIANEYDEDVTFDVTAEDIVTTRYWEESLSESVAADATTSHTLNPLNTLSISGAADATASATGSLNRSLDFLSTASGFSLDTQATLSDFTDEDVLAGFTVVSSQVFSSALTFSVSSTFPFAADGDIIYPICVDDRFWITYSVDRLPLAEDTRNWLAYKPLRVIIATELEGMPTVTLLETKDPVEVILVQFRYDNLVTGETISSATVAATTYSGTDAAPSAIISGSATISGSTVTQKIVSGTSGVTYKLRCSATTSTARVLVIPALLPVETL